MRVVGAIQSDTTPRNGQRCDMDVRVIPDGPVIRISQSLGAGARGCRLDPAALENAVTEVAARLDDAADLLLINKFGKHEAEGRGFRSLIAEALEYSVPVLLAVNTLNLDAFLAFTGGMAKELPSDVTALEHWLDGHLRVDQSLALPA